MDSKVSKIREMKSSTTFPSPFANNHRYNDYFPVGGFSERFRLKEVRPTTKTLIFHGSKNERWNATCIYKSPEVPC